MKHISSGCRRGFSLFGCLWVLAAATLLQGEGEEPNRVPWVLKAGNMDSDFERETFLLSVLKTEDLAPTDREDLEVFLAFLDQWNRGKELRNHAETLRDFFPGFSSEIRVTDRTMRFPALFTDEATLYGASLANIHEPDTELVFASLTGEPGDGTYFSLNGVRWLTTPVDFAALVRTNRRESFEADLFHFGETTRSIEAELLLLKPGAWSARLVDSFNGEVLLEREVHLSNHNRRLRLAIPARTFCRLAIRSLTD